LAMGTLRRKRHREAAVVAHKSPPEAMLDQPSIAILAGKPKPAPTAERQRRIATAIEEQQRLFATFECVAHSLRQTRRNEAAARRPFSAQINRLDGGKRAAAETFRKMHTRIAAAASIHFGLDRRRRRHEHDRDGGSPCAYDRHVARVVARAVL